MKTWFEIGLDNGSGTRTVDTAKSIKDAKSKVEEHRHLVKPGMRLFVDKWNENGDIEDSGEVLLDRTSEVIDCEKLRCLMGDTPSHNASSEVWKDWMMGCMTNFEVECIMYVHSLLLNHVDYPYALEKVLEHGYMGCLEKYQD